MLEHAKWSTDPAAHPTRYELLFAWPVIVADTWQVGRALRPAA